MLSDRTSIKEKSLVFIGFMGVGKTTIAQLVAKKLYRDFIDIDLEIEKEFNMHTTEIIKKKEKSLVFRGFIGDGKTTIAQLVTKKLYRDFIDNDLEIEKEFNMPTTEIFKLIGEEKFREKEKEYVKYYAEQPLKVISLGGGAFMQEEIREACLEHSIVFYLDITW